MRAAEERAPKGSPLTDQPTTAQSDSNGTPEGPIAYGKKQSHVWRPLPSKTWPQFVDWLDLDRPKDHKDCGAYVVGELQVTKGCQARDGGPDCVALHRNHRAVVSRWVLALDADSASRSFALDAAVELGCALAMYTTWSHTPETPRWRLLAPLSRPVDSAEYNLIARAVMRWLGDEQFDRGSKEPWRLMHRPSTQGGYDKQVVDGDPLDVDVWLARAAELELSPPKQTPPHADDSPRYADLDADEQERLDSYFQASRTGELEKLAALPQPWVSGESYWDEGVFKVACNLIEFANSNWCNYTLDQAHQDLLDHAPSDEAWGEADHIEKWESAEATTVGKARKMPPRRPDSGDDFKTNPIDGDTEPDAKQPLSVKLRAHVQEHYDAFPATADKRIFVQPKQGGRAELLTKNFVIRAAGHLGKKAASLSQPATEAATVLTAWALHEPPRTLALRAHYQPGRIVLDLAQTNSNRCVVVTPEGWTVEDVPPRDVVFQTSGAALPDPELGGSVDELRQLLRWNPDDERWMLVKGWLPCSLMADQNRPILCVFGPQGSAKSTTGRFVTGVFDPKPKGVLGGGFGKNRSDDETKALKHYVPAWDNVSTLSDEGADFLSRLVTGDLIEKRLLYSDADLVSISYRRTAVITGINMPRGVKPDTLDRLILVTLQHVEGARLTEGKLDAEWDGAQPRILAGVLDLAAKMLAGLPKAQNPADLRMADYAEALWAIDPALYDAYRDNVNSTRSDMAHDDPFIQVIVEWLRTCEGHEWEGTAEDAQQEAIYRADFSGAWWPKNGRVLSEQLNKCSELLRAVGVTVTERRSKKQRLKHFVLVEE